jgi:hypothetical protein
MYRVLKPTYEPTGEVARTDESEIRWQRATLHDIGSAESMADALRKFPRNAKNGYSPILEAVKNLH